MDRGGTVRLFETKLFLYGVEYELYECLGVCGSESRVTYVLLLSVPGRVVVPTVVPDKKPRVTKSGGVVTKRLLGREPAGTPFEVRPFHHNLFVLIP